MSRRRTDFDIDVRRAAVTAHIKLNGELDLESVPQVERALEPLEGDGVRRVILDLRDLRFIDSSGLNLLLQLDAHGRDGGPQLAVIHGGEAVRRIFDLTGLSDHFATVDPGSVDPASGDPASGDPASGDRASGDVAA
jgi:anti-sigma B factor antagonist